MLKNGSQYLYYATQLIGAATCNRLHFPEFSLQTLAQPSSDKNPHFWVCQWESVSISHGGSVNSYCFVLELMGPPPPHTHTHQEWLSSTSPISLGSLGSPLWCAQSLGALGLWKPQQHPQSLLLAFTSGQKFYLKLGGWGLNPRNII